jgi:hypothetical protein
MPTGRPMRIIALCCCGLIGSQPLWNATRRVSDWRRVAIERFRVCSMLIDAPIWRAVATSVGCLATLALASCGMPPPSPSVSCPSAVVDRGQGWHEAGGPDAWLLIDAPFVASPRYPRRLLFRIADASSFEGLSLMAIQRGTDVSKNGFIQSSPVTMEAGHGPPADLPGKVFFGGVELTSPGCWQIRVTRGNATVGMAYVEVVPDQKAEGIGS